MVRILVGLVVEKVAVLVHLGALACGSPGCGGRVHLSGLPRVDMHLSPQVRLPPGRRARPGGRKPDDPGEMEACWAWRPDYFLSAEGNG